MKKWGLVFLVAVVGLLVLRTSFSHGISKTLRTLSNNDKEALEWFFRSLHQASSSYVLFGNKPMSTCSFLEITPGYLAKGAPSIFFECMRLENLRLYRGWQTWKRYKHLFPSSHYALVENKEPGWITIVMINKPSFLQTIEENIEEFKRLLGSHITSQKILEDCLQGKPIFQEILNCHDELLGILFGYGKRNALLFARKGQIEESRLQSPSHGFANIQEEYEYINKHLISFCTGEIPDFNPLLMTLPGFIADPSSLETQTLQREYQRQYKKIIKCYKQKDYLEVTLTQFVHGEPGC